jgi:hypothetical protein
MVAVLIRAEGYLSYGNADISGGRFIKRWVQMLNIYGGSIVGLNTWSCVHHRINSELFRSIQDRVPPSDWFIYTGNTRVIGKLTHHSEI